jgi:hypothetical protein
MPRVSDLLSFIAIPYHPWADAGTIREVQHALRRLASLDKRAVTLSRGRRAYDIGDIPCLPNLDSSECSTFTQLDDGPPSQGRIQHLKRRMCK